MKCDMRHLTVVPYAQIDVLLYLTRYPPLLQRHHAFGSPLLTATRCIKSAAACVSRSLFVIMSLFYLNLMLACQLCWFLEAFPNLHKRQAASATASTPNLGISAGVSLGSSFFSWSPSQLVDVTGIHAYADPLPGQARGPCPAQNALANHGYLDRSGFITFLDCVAANRFVLNLSEEFAALLCFQGQLNSGDLLGVQFSIGNSSAVDPTIKSSCAGSGLLGGLFNVLTCTVSPFLNRVLGTPGFGMAQTHNSFEGDASFFKTDWGTTMGLDASTVDLAMFREFGKKMLTDKTFDNYQIIADWAKYRKQYSIDTNPCAFRAPLATLVATLGAYTFVPRIFSNFTPEHPNGTLTGPVLASWNGIAVDGQGGLSLKGAGKERIPDNW
jgi:Peroxidase, family 2